MMLRISKLTDYATVILGYIASADSNEMHSATEIANLTGIASPTVSKLLKLLAKGRVLRSVRGVKGGYFLSRPPEDISVADVIFAVEGPIAVTECSLSEDNCEQFAACNLSTHWGKINSVIQAALESVTLADMIEPVEISIPIESLYSNSTVRGEQ